MNIINQIRKQFYERINCFTLDNQLTKEECKNLFVTEWNIHFEKLMKNRLVMGALRYGKIDNQKKVEAIVKKANKYMKTGNLEYLVDLANYCMLEFGDPSHSKAHFESTDDEDHCNKRSNS